MRKRLRFPLLSLWILALFWLPPPQNAGADGPAPVSPPASAAASASSAINNPIFPSVGLPNSDLAPITGTNVTDPVSDLIRRMLITIGGSTLNNPGAIIDRIVGDPWALNPSTAEKLERFDARLHLQMDSAVAANPSPILSATAMPPVAGMQDNHGLPPMLVNAKAAGPVFTDAANRMTNYFTPEELIDLGVYYLSKQPFFPKTQAGWDAAKSDIISNAVPIALAVLAVGAASNQGTVSVDGKIFKVKDSDFKMGWYSSVRNLGISLMPALRGGLSAQNGKYESTAGLVYDVNPGPGLERAGVELSMREHVLRSLVAPSGWDIGFFTGGHYSLLNGNVVEQGKFRQEFDFYAKKDHFADTPTLEALGSASFSTDFKTQTSTKVNIGFDDLRYDLAGGFSFARSTDTENAIGNSYNVGIFFGGSFDNKTEIAKSRMEQDKHRVENRLAAANRAIDLQEKLEDTLRLLQTSGVPDQIRENELNRELLRQKDAVKVAKSDLAAEFRDYLQFRTQYYVLAGNVKSRNQITDNFGPLEPETMDEVRSVLGNQPRYRSAALPSGQNPSAPAPARASGAQDKTVCKPEDVTPVAGVPLAPKQAGAARTWGGN
jgi:hypothetical protein